MQLLWKVSINSSTNFSLEFYRLHFLVPNNFAALPDQKIATEAGTLKSHLPFIRLVQIFWHLYGNLSVCQLANPLI